MSMNELIEKMRSGNKAATIEGLFHGGAIFRMDAIGYSAIFHYDDTEIIARIRHLKDDLVTLDGYSVSDFAHAALDIMGVEPYCGDKITIKNLIELKFDFLM